MLADGNGNCWDHVWIGFKVYSWSDLDLITCCSVICKSFLQSHSLVFHWKDWSYYSCLEWLPELLTVLNNSNSLTVWIKNKTNIFTIISSWKPLMKLILNFSSEVFFSLAQHKNWKPGKTASKAQFSVERNALLHLHQEIVPTSSCFLTYSVKSQVSPVRLAFNCRHWWCVV